MSLSAQVLKVAHTIDWESPEATGGQQQLPNGSIVYFRGSGVVVLNEIVEVLKLKESTMFGTYILEAFELVANGTADIGSTLITHDETWIKSGLGSRVVFLHPLVQAKSEVYFRQAPSENLSVTVLRPFTFYAWLTYLLFCAMITLIIHVTSLIGNRTSSTNTFASLIKAFTTCMGILTGLLTIIKTDHGSKLFGLVASILRVIMFSLYTAKILAVLAAKDNIVQSPDDLLKYGYKFYTYSPVHIDRLFQNHHARHRIAYDTIYAGQHSSSIEGVIGKGQRDPRQALLAHPDGFYPQAIFGLHYSHEICQVSRFKSKVSSPRSLFMQKDSPHRERINLQVIKHLELGLNFRLQRRFEEKYKFHCPPKTTEVNPISIQHASFALITLFTGQCIAFALHFIFKS